MNLDRSSGILLHPTSFPSLDGIGDLGPQAFYWIDFLKAAGCSLWQILPLGPTGYGDSPYQSFSSFAGNPYLISSITLYDEGLLAADDFMDRPNFPERSVDFGKAIQWKLTLLDRAFENFMRDFDSYAKDFQKFTTENKYWLEEYALFMAIKDTHDGVSWLDWPADLRQRKPKALHEFKKEHQQQIDRHLFYQFMFFRQWANLKEYANQQGITIIGDVPIFVSMDSSDVWSHPELFFLDKDGHPSVVAGVPPDYFSPTGQLWGNPLYNWSEHEKTNYEWWIQRIKSTLKSADLIRMDHFRGFSGYWEVPAGMPTAEKGRWVKVNGEKFFAKVKEELGELPFIAEDLGEISQDVVDLRDSLNLPGMRILQFAFGDDARNPFLPHNYVHNCVAYTGTHDNDTSIGWYQTANEKERDYARKYLSTNGMDIAWRMVDCVFSSVAVFALAPLQDILQQGKEARMNFPGKSAGNWKYQFASNDLTPDLAIRIRQLNIQYNRIPAINRIPLEKPDIAYEAE